MPRKRDDHAETNTVPYDWDRFFTSTGLSVTAVAESFGVAVSTMHRILHSPQRTPRIYAWAAYGLEVQVLKQKEVGN